MRPVNDFQPPVSSTALVAAAKTRASGKAKPINSLHTNLGDDPYLETRSGKDRRKSASCQTGTPTSVPFRHSPGVPRLDAAFVAQLLGQMMPDRAAGQARMLAAYEEPQSSAQIFDTEL
jgi:hypothetical protein